MTDISHSENPKKYSYTEISRAVAETEYALSLLSLDLLRPYWEHFFSLDLSADEIAVCSDYVRTSLTDYRKGSDALDDGPDFMLFDALEMKRHLSLLSGTLEYSLGTSIATQVITWIDDFSRLCRQGSFGMAWSSILLLLRDQETAAILRHLGIIEALPRLQEIGHAYATYMDTTDCEIDKLKAAQKSEWDQQEFEIYAGDSPESDISLLDTVTQYLWTNKKEKLRLEILKILDSHNQQTPFRQWAKAIMIEKVKVAPHNFDPPTLYNLRA